MSSPSTTDAIPVQPAALTVGDEMAVYTLGPLTRTDFVRYAGAGGDLNPVHHDEPLAQRTGLPGVFGMGMFHAGVLGVRVAHWVGPLNLRDFSVRFTGQVWPGDTLTFTGVVTAINEVDGDPEADLEFVVTRGADDVVLRARGRATISREG